MEGDDEDEGSQSIRDLRFDANFNEFGDALTKTLAHDDDYVCCLRGHALIEKHLEKLVSRNLLLPETIDFVNLGFRGSLKWAVALGEVFPNVAHAIRRFGKFRGALAHGLEQPTDADIELMVAEFNDAELIKLVKERVMKTAKATTDKNLYHGLLLRSVIITLVGILMHIVADDPAFIKRLKYQEDYQAALEGLRRSLSAD